MVKITFEGRKIRFADFPENHPLCGVESTLTVEEVGTTPDLIVDQNKVIFRSGKGLLNFKWTPLGLLREVAEGRITFVSEGQS